MPWKQVQVSEQRLKFAIEASKPGNAMAGVCREHGISRQTGYLWLKRYEEGGAAAVMEERSRRPLRSPQRAGDAIEGGKRGAAAAAGLGSSETGASDPASTAEVGVGI